MRQSVETAPPTPPTTMDMSGGANQIGVRAYNERLVLSLVRRHGGLSKAEISRLCGARTANRGYTCLRGVVLLILCVANAAP